MKKTGMPPICAASRFSYNTMNPCFHLHVISDQKHRLDRHDLIEFLLGDGHIFGIPRNVLLHKIRLPSSISLLIRQSIFSSTRNL